MHRLIWATHCILTLQTKTRTTQVPRYHILSSRQQPSGGSVEALPRSPRPEVCMAKCFFLFPIRSARVLSEYMPTSPHWKKGGGTLYEPSVRRNPSLSPSPHCNHFSSVQSRLSKIPTVPIWSASTTRGTLHHQDRKTLEKSFEAAQATSLSTIR
jgi:hypothetical protein